MNIYPAAEMQTFRRAKEKMPDAKQEHGALKKLRANPGRSEMTKKATFAVLLAFLLFCPCSGVFAAEHPWELKKNEDGIQVHVRQVDGSAILEYKGVTVVNAGLDKVVRLFEEDARVREWFHQCSESRLIRTNSPEDKVLYFVIAMPWPVKDRDLVFRRIRSKDSATGAVEYRTSVAPKVFPRQKDKIRMPYLNGIWRFTPLKDGRTEMYYQQHSEVGGHIPAWLVNRLAVNIPFNSLANFRRLATTPKTTH
jgi:hypothetical protein